MKPSRTSRLFGALLFAGSMSVGFQSHAHAPLQHPARGVIQSIDYTNRTLVLTESATATNRIFVWKSYTCFRRGWHKASPDMLRAGEAIKVWYRKEVGQFVLYEVRWTDIVQSNHVGNTSSR
jgi:hypothetical protein